jgi:CO dehydrogenase maturation factor
MGKTLVVTGRGGSGKTTFVALAAKHLKASPLLIDADPEENLSDMVGVDLKNEKIKTVSEMLFDIQKGEIPQELKSMPMPMRIGYAFNNFCIYESAKFDLVTLGVKWTKGCYCLPNEILRDNIPKLISNYTYTLIDSPAGLEHINRRIISEIDGLFVLLDPSIKSFKNVKRILQITKNIDINFNHLYLVANYRFQGEIEKYINNLEGDFLGKIEYDPKVEEYNLKGKSLLELPENSPAYETIKKILIKTEYK